MWRGQLSEMESSGEIRTRLVLRSSFRVPIPSGPVLRSHWTPTCIDSSFLQITCFFFYFSSHVFFSHRVQDMAYFINM
ncbi:hypothetical protein CEXT_104951 [Caerostris extrusa]|uniref:Uncharacterized protein n=1 Tax=Caerostris extrusa TaxID=172846 RepID=A0AAV4T8Q0_CAEEX|nr:hypothetical protein CEXT_104951 [Caerostris extrusa]